MSTVTIKPPASLGGSNIELNAERVDYTINNDVQQKLTGTTHGRIFQKVNGIIQITITGFCCEENGNSAIENAELIETAVNIWGQATTPGDNTTYSKINWLFGDKPMLIQKFTFIEDGWSEANEINYIMTVYLDTRV